MARASASYSPPMQLLGKLYRGKGGWVADWVFVDNGKILSKWTSNNAMRAAPWPPAPTVPAEALMKRYGKRGSGGPAGTYRLIFTGIDSADDYFIRLSAAYCRACAWYARSPPFAPAAIRLEVDLELLTGIPGFKRMLGDDSPLEGGEGDPPVYHLR